MGGTASWSTKQSTASSFASSGSMPTIYRAAKQKRATSVSGLSNYPSEHEVASHSKARYRVTNIEYGTWHGKKYRYIDVEPI